MSGSCIARGVVGLLLVVFFCSGAEPSRAEAGRKLLADMAEALRSASKSVKPTCEVGAPFTGQHHAHGHNPLDFTRRITLANARVKYGLKYWMNVRTVDGADPVAIEGTTGLGMDRPSAANWYANNFFEFTYGGAPILKTVLAEFSEEPKGVLRICWRTAQADVVALVSLPADGIHLVMTLQVTAHGAAKPFTVGFRAYPGHTAKPHTRRVQTTLRLLSPTVKLSLPREECRLVLYDKADVARTACAIDVRNTGQRSTELNLQTYGVTVTLGYPPAPRTETGAIRIWDLGRGSVNDAMDLVLADEGTGK